MAVNIAGYYISAQQFGPELMELRGRPLAPPTPISFFTEMYFVSSTDSHCQNSSRLLQIHSC